mmetsp:Transcript_12856/g.36561  ORF Transcript_12856/g.36561 Transcript_12856/m.36561 type:complete len:275 (+) Transcript_12856:1439-2263(+)
MLIWGRSSGRSTCSPSIFSRVQRRRDRPEQRPGVLRGRYPGELGTALRPPRLGHDVRLQQDHPPRQGLPAGDPLREIPGPPRLAPWRRDALRPPVRAGERALDLRHGGEEADAPRPAPDSARLRHHDLPHGPRADRGALQRAWRAAHHAPGNGHRREDAARLQGAAGLPQPADRSAVRPARGVANDQASPQEPDLPVRLQRPDGLPATHAHSRGARRGEVEARDPARRAGSAGDVGERRPVGRLAQRAGGLRDLGGAAARDRRRGAQPRLRRAP